MTGTDTEVGKTVFSAALIRFLVNQGHSVAGLKPIASGFEQVGDRLQNEDVQRISAAANVCLPPERINRYGFKPAIAPHIAAINAGVTMDLNAIASDLQYALSRSDSVIVEGVGGWLVPLDERNTIESLARLLALPVILVVGMRLGCLNHALLTAQAIQRSGLPFAGWVSNHIQPEFSHVSENLATLESSMPVPRLFDLPYFDNIDESFLTAVRD